MPIEFDAPTRVALASYLRRRPYAWRRRRRDYIVPLDFHLVRRQITLQGQLDEELFRAFAAEQHLIGADLQQGDELMIYMPFATFAKQVLLDFSTFDPAGQRVALLTRSHGAHITAEHLLSLFPARVRPRNRDDRLAVTLVLEAIARLNPTALARRARDWLNQPEAAALAPDEQLGGWLSWELAAFSEGLNSRTRDLQETLVQLCTEVPLVERDADLHEDTFLFASLTELVVVGIAATLDIVASLPPSEYADGRSPRNRILAHRLRLLPRGIRALGTMLDSITAQPDSLRRQLNRRHRRLARKVGNLHPYVMDLRDRLEVAEAEARAAGGLRQAVEREVMNAALSWMAYLAVPVRLGQPFHFRTSELLPLEQPSWAERQRRRLQTRHVYSFDMLDAPSTHIEIAVSDPALKIATGRTRVHLGPTLVPHADSARPDSEASAEASFAGAARREARDRRRARRERRWITPPGAFAQEFRESERVMHFYATGAPSRLPFRNRTGRVNLRVQYNIVSTIKVSYGAAVGLVLAAIAYATFEWLSGAPAPASRADVIAIGVGFLSFIVTFIVSSERTPLARGKLEAFRLIFYGVFLALIGIAIAWSTTEANQSGGNLGGNSHPLRNVRGHPANPLSSKARFRLRPQTARDVSSRLRSKP